MCVGQQQQRTKMETGIQGASEIIVLEDYFFCNITVVGPYMPKNGFIQFDIKIKFHLLWKKTDKKCSKLRRFFCNQHNRNSLNLIPCDNRRAHTISFCNKNQRKEIFLCKRLKIYVGSKQ